MLKGLERKESQDLTEDTAAEGNIGRSVGRQAQMRPTPVSALDQMTSFVRSTGAAVSERELAKLSRRQKY